jgi:hypothetical protein
VDYAFELRNIVLALSLLWNDPNNRSELSIDPAELSPLKPLLRSRLADPSHREDLSSSIALAQILYFLSYPEPLSSDDCAWMSADPRRLRFDVGLQIRSLQSMTALQPDPEFLGAAVAELGKQTSLSSLAPVIRLLDTVAVLDQAGLLDCQPGTVRDLAELACGHLEALADQAADGWLSVEATANAARGLVVLLERLGADYPVTAVRVADNLGKAMSVLSGSFGQYQRNRKGVAWLAGLTLAAVRVQRQFPIGLQRLASLDWPEELDDSREVIGTGLPLLRHLAAENKALRDRERQFDAERTAARFGRAAATLGTLAGVGCGVGYAVARLGFASVWGLTGNTILLTALVGVVALWLSWLRRLSLLAGPAVHVLEWITPVVPWFARLGRRDSQAAQ